MPHAGAFAKAYVAGEGYVAFEFSVETHVRNALETSDPRLVDMDHLTLDFALNGNAQSLTSREHIANEYLLQELRTLHYAFQRHVFLVVVWIEGKPVVQVVVEVSIPHLHKCAVREDGLDVVLSGRLVPQRKRKVAVSKERPYLLNTLANTDNGSLTTNTLILYHRITVAEGFALMIME